MARPRLCVYCGEKEATTMDHVAPKCLFGDPKPPNLITVPACADCNNRKSQDDTLLRDALAVDIDNKHPIAKHLLDTKVKRAVQRNRSEIARLIAKASEAQPRFDYEGKSLGDAHRVDLASGTMDRILSRMVRGLYCSETGEILRKDHEFVVLRQPTGMFSQLYERMGNPPTGKLGSVFGFAWVRVNDPLKMIWLLWFYDSVVYSVMSRVIQPSTVPTGDATG